MTQIPPQFWSGPVVAAALAECDLPTILEEVRRAHGWTQGQLAEEVGYSHSWVSKVLRGRQLLTVDQVREISIQIGVPLHLLRFGARGDDDTTRRRDFGKALALTALAGVALPKRPDVDETTAATLTSITGAQRRLESVTPARELARPAVAQVDLVSRVLGRASRSPHADEIRAGLSEAAGFAAWVHADMQDTGSARLYYRRAVDSARQANHALLAAYMIGSLAAFEIDANDPLIGLNLLARARREIGERPPAIARAWLSSLEALGHATARDEAAALQALSAAEAAVRAGERTTAPPWPWVFPFDHAKLAGYRALVMVRLKRPVKAVAAFNESLSSAQPGAKQRGVLMTEVAAAEAMSGHYDEALYLASNALTVATTYGSERVLHRVKNFRRTYAGPSSGALRLFDERLHATLI